MRLLSHSYSQQYIFSKLLSAQSKGFIVICTETEISPCWETGVLSCSATEPTVDCTEVAWTCLFASSRLWTKLVLPKSYWKRRGLLLADLLSPFYFSHVSIFIDMVLRTDDNFYSASYNQSSYYILWKCTVCKSVNIDNFVICWTFRTSAPAWCDWSWTPQDPEWPWKTHRCRPAWTNGRSTTATNHVIIILPIMLVENNNDVWSYRLHLRCGIAETIWGGVLQLMSSFHHMSAVQSCFGQTMLDYLQRPETNREA